MGFQRVSITIYEINSRKRGSIHVQSTKYVFLETIILTKRK